MNHQFRFTALALGTILALLFSLTTGAGAAFADGPTPPPSETPEVVTTPEAEQVTSEAESTDELTTPAAESIPTETLDTLPATEEVLPTEAEGTQISVLLAELPETTGVIVLNEQGESLPLASQEAVEIAESVDPMWCPVVGGVPTLPGGSGCTINFASSQALINNIDSSNPGSSVSNYEQNGIIYFTATASDSFLLVPGSGNALDTADYNALKIFNLTLQGGWNGLNNGAGFALNGQSNFGTNRIQIGTNTAAGRWAGNITLNDFQFNGVSSGNAITIYTTSGDVTLNNVDVLQQTGSTRYSALIDSNAGGDIIVQNESTFDGNGNNRGFSATTTAGGMIAVTGTSTDPITFTDAMGSGTSTNYSGATLRAPTITLTYVLASGNDLNGIQISNAGSVTLNNVVAINNGTERTPDGASNNLGSGVSITGTGSAVVTVNGGAFSGNQLNGLSIASAPTVIVSNATTSNNDLNGILMTGANNVFLNNITASNNGTEAGAVGSPSNLGSGVSITGTGAATLTVNNSAFSGNQLNGLSIASAPTITLNNAVASNNDLNGILITSANSVTLNNVTAANNGTDPPTGANLGSGVRVTGTGTTLVTVMGGTYLVNQRYGIEVTNGTLSIQSPPDCGSGSSANILGCYRPNTAPSLSLPSNMTVEATSSSGAVVSYTATAADSQDVSLTPTCSPASGSTFPIATTTVNCSVTDSGGLTRSGSFTVTVRDTTAPALSLPSNMTVEASGPSGRVVTYTASAIDLVDGPRTVTCTPPSGSNFSFGTTPVNCSASDTRGNTANGTFYITVQDTTPPVLTLPADMILEATGPSGATAAYSVSASDLVDGTRTATCTPLSGSTFALGTTSVDCSASDTRGNTATDSFSVTVQDTTPPAISAHEDISIIKGNKGGMALSYTSPSTSDVVDGTGSSVCSPASGSIFPIGDTTVTCNAVDAHGNAAAPVTFVVYIEYKNKGSLPANSGIIPITGGAPFDIACQDPAIYNLEDKSVLVAFTNLCNYQAVLDDQDTAGLPGRLPDGETAVSGLTVSLLKNGSAVDSLPVRAGISLSFAIPSGMNVGNFTVLQWDGRQWREVAGIVMDGYLEVQVESPGTYILAHQ